MSETTAFFNAFGPVGLHLFRSQWSLEQAFHEATAPWFHRAAMSQALPHASTSPSHAGMPATVADRWLPLRECGADADPIAVACRGGSSFGGSSSMGSSLGGRGSSASTLSRGTGLGLGTGSYMSIFGPSYGYGVPVQQSGGGGVGGIVIFAIIAALAISFLPGILSGNSSSTDSDSGKTLKTFSPFLHLYPMYIIIKCVSKASVTNALRLSLCTLDSCQVCCSLFHPAVSWPYSSSCHAHAMRSDRHQDQVDALDRNTDWPSAVDHGCLFLSRRELRGRLVCPWMTGAPPGLFLKLRQALPVFFINLVCRRLACDSSLSTVWVLSGSAFCF